jgi:hypothetical protein
MVVKYAYGDAHFGMSSFLSWFPTEKRLLMDTSFGLS